jgi:hypothetical protein
MQAQLLKLPDLHFSNEIMRKLLIHLVQTRLDHPFTWQSKQGLYGGYSITSSTGCVKDGWVGAGGLMFTRQADGNYASVANPEAVRQQHNILPLASYCQPTAIHTGVAADVLQRIQEYFGQPLYRSRYGVQGPSGHGGWHTDGAQHTAGVWRIHLPVHTNPGAVFCWRKQGQELMQHLPADGSVYLTRINTEHRIINTGVTSRCHLHTMTGRAINPDLFRHDVIASL